MRNAPFAGVAALTLIALTLASGSASAQTGSAEALVQSFSRCRAIDVAEARLDCFDKAAQALEKAVRSRDITIADRQEVRSAQRSLFGFTIGRIPLFGGGEREDEKTKRDAFDRLDTTVVSTRPLANGNVELRVAEGGAVWATTEAMPFPPRAGTKVTITRGALGGYFIEAAGQRSVRGMRVR